MEKVRLSRTTHKQYEYLIQFLEQNSVITRGKSTPSEVSIIKDLWKKFAAEINSKNIGPFKTVDQWKRILTEWKANTKRKSHTGGGPPSKKKLTDLKERLLSVITKIHLGDDLLPDTLGGNIAESTSSTTGAIDVSFEVHDANMEIVDLNEEITYGESIAQISDDAFENVISPTDVLIPEDAMSVEKSNVKPAKLKIKKTNTNERYTSKILREALEKFTEGQNAIVDATAHQVDAVGQLTNILSEVSETLKKKNDILQAIADAKAVKAEAAMVRAKAEEMKVTIEIIKLKNELEYI
ncbi:Myb/SANT-like DNA-binding domain [Popillia japonica]|uniref:Regulatory protein zeste n=1 Tax=Popillia japonica TaxID=7064 RepID=A0AAW1JVC5_POPJA